MTSRGKLILQQLKDRKTLELLENPSFESTKGTTAAERDKALSFKGWNLQGSTSSAAPAQQESTSSAAPTQQESTSSAAPAQQESTSSAAPTQQESTSSAAPAQQESTSSAAPTKDGPNQNQEYCLPHAEYAMEEVTEMELAEVTEENYNQLPLSEDSFLNDFYNRIASAVVIDDNSTNKSKGKFVLDSSMTEKSGFLLPYTTEENSQVFLDISKKNTSLNEADITNQTAQLDNVLDDLSSSDDSLEDEGQLIFPDNETPREPSTSSLFVEESVPRVSNKSSPFVDDKKHSCIYCKKLVCKLPKHFERVHPDKHEVAEILTLPKAGKYRAEKLKQLRHKGNYAHNMKVLTEKSGVLIVVRRTKKDTRYTEYLPCQYCKGFYYKKKLWRHTKSCPDNDDIMEPCSSKHVISSAFLSTPNDVGASQLFHDNLLSTMLEGPEKALIRNDKILCVLGSKEMEKHRFLPQLKNQISFKLRLLARLVLELKQSHPKITTISHCVLKENFNVVASAVAKITIEKGKPSLGKKMGHCLKKCATIVKNMAIVEENVNLRRSVEDFLILYEEEWKDKISIPATALLHRRRYDKPVEMPLPEDIIKLNKYILNKEKHFISSDFKDAAYIDVAKVVLAHIIVFNRRRAGEVSLMEVESFQKRTTSSRPTGEVSAVLSQNEIRTFEQLEIVYLRGKKGSKVDCILTPNMVKCIKFLLNNRARNGIRNDNIYLFCLPGSKQCMRGHDAIKEMATNCGAAEPMYLKSTKLRRHVSTVSQLLNLNDNDFNALCKHMGHNPSVHREYYQMDEETVLKTQISKILLSLQEGSVAKHKGKKLSEFQVNVSDESEAKDKSVGEEEVTENMEIEIANSPYMPDELESDSDSSEESLSNTPEPITINKKKSKRMAWSKEDIKILNDFFAEEITIGKRPPTKKRCEECLSKYPSLKNGRNYLKIKWRVHAIIQENNKRKKK